MAKSLGSAPPSQPNRGSHGKAPTQKPKVTTDRPGSDNSAPGLHETPQRNRGYINPGHGAAPSNGQSGNSVDGRGFHRGR